jgi:hypothetical protein
MESACEDLRLWVYVYESVRELFDTQLHAGREGERRSGREGTAGERERERERLGQGQGERLGGGDE